MFRINFRYILLITLLTACFSADSAVIAQLRDDIKMQLRIPDSLHIQIITTFDQSINFGRIISIAEDQIIFKTEYGLLKIPLSKIKEIQTVPISRIKKGDYWFPNPNSTRLFFAPSARLLKKGDGYFSSYYLFLMGVAYGLTDNITIGGGVSLLPGVDPQDQIFFLTPKVAIAAT
ncbi:MAG: hypothetical protein SCK70_11105 [bacterium]|nr:hypothetical protein [bacterium]